MLLYFAYGSNMSPERIQSRVPSAQPFFSATLHEHQLRFHKRSHVDNSAKCDAFHTGDPIDAVHGMLYTIEEHERTHLDQVEGLGKGYEIKEVVVRTFMGDTLEAFTYYATDIESGLRPLDWYKDHVLIGARFAQLPDEYIAEIVAVEASCDPDHERRNRELSIYL